MANSKVNTEETILRTPTDTPANADANSVRVYTDGTNVYSKDASGTVVNLSKGPESIKFSRKDLAEIIRYNRSNLFESMSNTVDELIWIDTAGAGLTSGATESNADIVNIFADGFSGTSVSVYEQTLNSVNYGLALFFEQGTASVLDAIKTINFKVTAYAQHPFNSSDQNRTALGATVLKSSASYNAANTGGSGGGFVESFLYLTKAETESLFNSIGSTDCSHGIYIECKLYNSSAAITSPASRIKVSGFHLLADVT